MNGRAWANQTRRSLARRRPQHIVVPGVLALKKLPNVTISTRLFDATVGLLNSLLAVSPLLNWQWILAWFHGIGPSIALLAAHPRANHIVPWGLLQHTHRGPILQALHSLPDQTAATSIPPVRV